MVFSGIETRGRLPQKVRSRAGCDDPLLEKPALLAALCPTIAAKDAARMGQPDFFFFFFFYWNLKPLGPRQRSVLEVVLQDAGGQRGVHCFALTLDGAHDFAATDNFRGRKSGDLRRQYQIDFQL